nr:expressed protein [Hymenolepis microstoma]
MTFPLSEGAINPQVASILEDSREKFNSMARSWTLNYAWVRDSEPNPSATATQSSSEKNKKSSSNSKSSKRSSNKSSKKSSNKSSKSPKKKKN